LIQPLTSEEIAEAFERACFTELDALKPGNVHRHAPDARMTVADFERSAQAAAPALAEPRLTVGRRIRAGVEATIDAVGHNTNLGIILLAAPLAQAALAKGSGDLRQRIRQVLEHLTVEDARETYAAIRRARPGGLGEAERHDIRSEPEITLLEAMRAAEDRDRIAWNYTHGFSDLFDVGVPAFATAAARGDKLPDAATSVYLGFLASIPDTLIARKSGLSRALEVQREALPLQERLGKGMRPDALRPELLSLDSSLKERGLNPGTTADLTVATLFTVFLSALEMSN
jgi:triphosphoribosyl-dephospho-CoA synthase